jgi:hypothetical protein
VVTPAFEIVISPVIATSAGRLETFPTRIWPYVRDVVAPIGVPLKVNWLYPLMARARKPVLVALAKLMVAAGKGDKVRTPVLGNAASTFVTAVDQLVSVGPQLRSNCWGY